MPQTRQRAIVIGYRRDLEVTPSLPPPTHFGRRAIFSYLREELTVPSTENLDEILGESPHKRTWPSRARVAVFLDGCFWHGCPEHGEQPRANAEYWRTKIERNRRRDRRTDSALREASWLPVRIWEHEDPAHAAARIRQLIEARRG